MRENGLILWVQDISKAFLYRSRVNHRAPISIPLIYPKIIHSGPIIEQKEKRANLALYFKAYIWLRTIAKCSHRISSTSPWILMFSLVIGTRTASQSSLLDNNTIDRLVPNCLFFSHCRHCSLLANSCGIIRPKSASTSFTS